MMLGDVLARLDDDGAAAELFFGIGDLALMTAIQQQADAEGMDLATYARATMQRYTAEASDEEWVTLMGVIGRADDPASACIRRAFESVLRKASAFAPGDAGVRVE